ncbi:uncharacterized protein LOC132166902 [Corylus avellana]|uniref:uncharacterized protein LOC132166902 n=1 Tax=Corylus avellana TaxID=13451 RepID=UPI00286AD973|nr:uncharacterized protein LOC132166902 [Corylus avellana]
MVRKKDPFWEYAKDLKNGRFSCNFCKRDFAGGNSRIKAHLSGIRGRDIQICEKVPEKVQSQARDAVPPTKRAKNVAASNNIFEGKSNSGSSSLHMPNLREGQDKSTVDQHLVKFLVSEGIRPRAIESPFFKNFVNGVAEHGPSYELPHSRNITLKLAPNIKNEVEKYIENVIKESIKTGCTLMCEGWLYCNEWLRDIYAYTPIGVACIKRLKNPFGLASDEYFFSETTLSSVMEVIGLTNVVQFIDNYYDDDDDDDIGPIKDMFCHKYPWIYRYSTVDIFSPYEEICDIPVVQCTMTVAKWIVLYIYKYKVNISSRVVHKKDGFIDADVFKLMSLLEVESELQNLEVSIGTLSNEWGKLMSLNDPQVAKFMQETKFIDYAIHSKEFWRQVKMVAPIMQTLVQADCLINHDGPTLGYLYEMMERVHDAVEQCRESNAVLYGHIWKILKTSQIAIIRPVHAAAAFLNPIYMCSEKFKENDKMKNGVNHILERLVAVEEKEDFRNEEQLYRMKHSNVFTDEAMLMLKTYHPRIWWERYGNHLPVLQKYAIRILSQPCSFSLRREDRLYMGTVILMIHLR